MNISQRFEIYTIPGAAAAYGVPVEAIEAAILQGGIEVFRGAGARCVRAADVAALAASMEGRGDE